MFRCRKYATLYYRLVIFTVNILTLLKEINLYVLLVFGTVETPKDITYFTILSIYFLCCVPVKHVKKGCYYLRSRYLTCQVY